MPTGVTDAVLDTLPARIAVIDESGRIVETNAAWRAFTAEHDHPLVPEGTLSALAYPPSGVSGVGIATAFERSHRRLAHYFRAMGDGFCPNCGRDVTVTFPPDDEKHPGTPAGFSHVRYDGLVRLSCGFCGQRRIAHPLSATDDQEPMATFFGARGIEPGWGRMAAAMSWPVTSRDGRLAYETPDGTRFVVDDELAVTRE